MSEPETPYFRLSPEAPGTEPAGFDSHPTPALLSAESLAEILVTANHADEGRIRTYDLVLAYSRDVPDLLEHIKALTARAERAEATVLEAGKELGYTRQMFHETEEVVVKLTRRVKELSGELADQEVEKLALVLEVQALRNAMFKLERAARPI